MGCASNGPLDNATKPGLSLGQLRASAIAKRKKELAVDVGGHTSSFCGSNQCVMSVPAALAIGMHSSPCYTWLSASSFDKSYTP